VERWEGIDTLGPKEKTVNAMSRRGSGDCQIDKQGIDFFPRMLLFSRNSSALFSLLMRQKYD